MLIKSIKLTNFLSFGENSQELELLPLNVIIGPNGSGKSNLLEAIDLLRAAPRDIWAQVRASGGIHDLIWKGSVKQPSEASINAVLEYLAEHVGLRYVISFSEIGQRFRIIEERIEDSQPTTDDSEFIQRYYMHSGGHTLLSAKGDKYQKIRKDVIDIRVFDNESINTRLLDDDSINPTSSILVQRKDPDQYPELTWIGNMFGKIRLYREWNFGRHADPRLPQKTDLPNYFMESDFSNLGLVLNRLHANAESRKKILDALHALYENIDYFGVDIEGGTVQVFLQEGDYKIPATRLSDGTLRYLCLVATLCHPDPPPLICIEEPELGLHPDVLPTLARLLVDASERTQLIVTTHSEVLVDALTDQPESIVVAEKDENGTTLKRLDAESLKPWLEKYRLGDLWMRGKIGGTRW